MNEIPVVLIVGSGAAGAQAACQALEEGNRVVLLDYGNDDPHTAALIPDAPFSQIRAGDARQREYLLGADASHAGEIRVGAHLTAPRQFITRDTEALLPLQSSTFQAMQSLALGGLAAGWGAGAYTFEERELREAGLTPGQLRPFYETAAREIGVSGAREDDNAPYALEIENVQPALEIDSNARAILRAYERERARLQRMGFFLGRAPVAALTAPVEDPSRRPNPYFDMDFYGESRRSVYRPKYTIERLREHPRFRYVGGALAGRFREDADGVTLFYRRAGEAQERAERGDALLLAANAINTARIVLASFERFDVRAPLLSNPYHYVPCINLAMLGRPAADRRHSLAQLFGVCAPPHRDWERVTAAFYSYRSLLLYKLVKEMPLPAGLGLLAARAMLTAFTIVGVHHPDSPTQRKWLALGADGVLRADYALSDDERELVRADLQAVRRALLALRCVPLRVIDPGFGSSIHYAGTLPQGEGDLRTDANGRLNATRHVYAADSSGWTYLPAKGLTFTIMANARRIASHACAALRAASSTA